MRILFRYLSAQILAPFFTCLLGFIFLWVVFDIFDNGSDFIEAKAPLFLVIKFYWVQLPSMLAIGLPLAVLLASLFCLINLSRRNEFVAMQSSGLSLWQIGLPFILLGFLASVLLGLLHWKAAPEALKKREAILEDLEMSRDLAKDSKKKSEEIGVFQNSVVYRDAKSNRIWFIEKAEAEKARLQQVEILQVSPEGKDLWKYYVDSMTWDGNQWQMQQVLRIFYDEKSEVRQRELLTNFQDPRLEETFIEVTSLMKNPEALSVPELQAYVRQNINATAKRLAPYQTLLYYRRAVGVTCLAIVFVALTFALSSSKRNLLAGFSKTVVIYFAFLIAIHFFIALGKGGRIPPSIAGYLPIALFLLSGIVLFYWRSTRVELPRFMQFFTKS